MTDMTPREALEVVEGEFSGMCCKSLDCTECSVKRQALATLSALADRAGEDALSKAQANGAVGYIHRALNGHIWIEWFHGLQIPDLAEHFLYVKPPAAPGASHE